MAPRRKICMTARGLEVIWCPGSVFLPEDGVPSNKSNSGTRKATALRPWVSRAKRRCRSRRVRPPCTAHAPPERGATSVRTLDSETKDTHTNATNEALTCRVWTNEWPGRCHVFKRNLHVRVHGPPEELKLLSLHQDLLFQVKKSQQGHGQGVFVRFCVPPVFDLPLAMQGPIVPEGSVNNGYWMEDLRTKTVFDTRHELCGKLQHSMFPNTQVDPKTLQLVTLRAIAQGEELTISYGPDYIASLLLRPENRHLAHPDHSGSALVETQLLWPL